MPPSAPESRYRRRVLGVGGAVAFLVYVVGAPIFNNRIENDLEVRVPAALADAGYGTLSAKFSGQEGVLTCAAPLADPEGALAVAHDVRGVRSVELDRGCRVNTVLGDGSADETRSSTLPGSQPGGTNGSVPGTSVPDFASVGHVIAGDPQFSSLARLAAESDLADMLADTAAEPVTVFAPTDDAFDALPATVAGLLDDDPALRATVARSHVVRGALDRAALTALAGATVTTLDGAELAVVVEGTTVTVGAATVASGPIDTPNGTVYALDQVILPAELAAAAPGAGAAATLAEGVLTLSGAVADQAARDTLVFAGTAAVGADRLDDQLTIDAGAGVDAETAAELATLIAALDAELVSGTAASDGSVLSLSGAYANDADAARATVAATAVGAMTDLTPRAAASPEQAAALEEELNEFVRANAITFAQGSAVLDDSAVAIIDRVAARLVELGALTVVVEGHTDSDGSATTNQTLSEQRAGAVRQALVDRGVAADTISAEGFGSQEPVLSTSGIEDKTASRRVEFRISAG